MNSTFQNSAQVLSIGIFFTLMIIGLASTLPSALYHGLVTHGLSSSAAHQASNLPPVSTLFAAFLGYSPVEHLVGPAALAHLSAAQRGLVTGRSFFPSIISGAFKDGLHIALDFAVIACLIAAGASWLRGGKYVYSEPASESAAGVDADGAPAAVGNGALVGGAAAGMNGVAEDASPSGPEAGTEILTP